MTATSVQSPKEVVNYYDELHIDLDATQAEIDQAIQQGEWSVRAMTNSGRQEEANKKAEILAEARLVFATESSRKAYDEELITAKPELKEEFAELKDTRKTSKTAAKILQFQSREQREEEKKRALQQFAEDIQTFNILAIINENEAEKWSMLSEEEKVELRSQYVNGLEMRFYLMSSMLDSIVEAKFGEDDVKEYTFEPLRALYVDPINEVEMKVPTPLPHILDGKTEGNEQSIEYKKAA